MTLTLFLAVVALIARPAVAKSTERVAVGAALPYMKRDLPVPHCLINFHSRSSSTQLNVQEEEENKKALSVDNVI